jgi:predicted SAM-dependent methyltransferase
MRLNLGCGADFRPGWLNVDCRRLYPEGRDFLCCDLRALDGRIEDGSAEEIAALDVLEHLPWREVDAVLAVLGKKLAPRGVLFLRVVDFEALARDFVEGHLPFGAAQRLLYGEQGHPQDARLSLWSAGLVEGRLALIGLRLERLEHRDGRLLAWGRRLE